MRDRHSILADAALEVADRARQAELKTRARHALFVMFVARLFWLHLAAWIRLVRDEAPVRLRHHLALSRRWLTRFDTRIWARAATWLRRTWARVTRPYRLRQVRRRERMRQERAHDYIRRMQDARGQRPWRDRWPT